MLAIIAVLMVLMPITWVLFRNGGSGMAADNDTPYVEWVDDRYQSAKPTVADWTTTEPTEQPSGSPTRKPSKPPTGTPTSTPTDRLSTAPTDSPTESGRPTSRPTSPGQTQTPTSRPTTTNSPTSPPSTPGDDGGMSGVERELYDLIGAARADHGCGALRPDSNLTGSARAEADRMAKKDQSSPGGGTDAAAKGDGGENARDAFDQMMNSYSSILLDCTRHRLGIGLGSHTYCGALGCFLTGEHERTRWVADFA